MEQPAGRTPPKGHCSLCLALLPSSYVTFHIPVSTLGTLSPVQAPDLDNSTPCPDFCPGFCFCPASSLLPSCPPVFISLLTREHRAPSHPNPATEVWQHPVGFNSWAELRIIKGPDGFLPQFDGPGRAGMCTRYSCNPAHGVLTPHSSCFHAVPGSLWWIQVCSMQTGPLPCQNASKQQPPMLASY